MNQEEIKTILIKGFVVTVVIHGIYATTFPDNLIGLDHPSNLNGFYTINLHSGSTVAFPVIASIVETTSLELLDIS